MTRKLIKASILACVLIAALLLCACAGQNLEPGDTVATLSGESITVSAAFTEQLQNAKKDQTVYLFAVAPDVSVGELLSSEPEPLAEAKMAGKLSFTVPLCENGESRLTTGFILATYDKLQKAYQPLHDCPVYISNPEALAENHEALPEHSSIKGVTAESTSHVIALGASHALVELPIEDYILPVADENAIRHEFGGVSYYFSRAAIEALDKKISALSKAGIEAYIRIYLGSSHEDLPKELKYLSYPGTEDGSRYYTVNFSDGDAMLSYSAFTDLLCSRYAKTGNTYSIIVGKGANSADLGSKQDFMKSGIYTDDYAKALRITHNILLSYCKNGQVYLSIDDNLYAPKEAGMIDGEEFLTSVAAVAKDQGDYRWGVAAECSASFAKNDSVWNDTESASSLTPTNLSTLTDVLLERDELTYGDVIRPVIISDFTIYSNPEEPISEENQAVSYAYTYYEAVKNGKIRALFYSELLDNEYSFDGIINADGEKEIYRMIKKIDTDYDLSDDVGNLIGSVWTKLYENDDLRDAVQRGKYLKGSATLGSAEKYDLATVLSFGGGTLAGFDTVADGHAGLVRIDGASQLIAHFDPRERSGDFSIAVNGISPDLISGSYLVVPLRITTGDDIAVEDYRISLTLLQNEPNGEIRIYSSTLTLEPDADKTAIFNISEFSGNKLSGDVTMLISVTGSDKVAFDLTVGDILSANEPANNWWVILLIVLGILLVGAGIVVFVLWFRKNYTLDFGSSKSKPKNNGGNKRAPEGN